MNKNTDRDVKRLETWGDGDLPMVIEIQIRCHKDKEERKKMVKRKK